MNNLIKESSIISKRTRCDFHIPKAMLMMSSQRSWLSAKNLHHGDLHLCHKKAADRNLDEDFCLQIY